jgi:O-antigen/teichoic acid export membrane protein
MAEGVVSLLAFLSVLATAGLAEKYLTESQGVAWMFVVYAVGLLANFNVETAAGVLQVARKIELQGVFNLTQNILATLIIGAALFLKGSLLAALGAYLLGKVVLGLAMFAAAQIQLDRTLGAGWRQTPLSHLTAVRDMFRFALSSNFSATIIKIFRESELLWAAFFLPTETVGLYSVAYTLVSFIAIPADPLISTTFPEINRLTVEKAWNKLKDFLRKITALSFAVNLALGFGFIVFGRWAIFLYAGAEFLGAYPALVALTIGLIFNYTFFWNRPLLLALGLPEFPIWATLAAGLVKLGLAFWLIPTYGVAAAGALLSYYYIASVWIIVLRGVKQIRIEAEG